MTSSVSARAAAKARTIISELGIYDALQIDVEAIAFARGALVVERPLRGASARLIRRGDKGVIAVREDIRELGQKRFCVAHELGHFELHKKADQLAFCTDEMVSWYKARPEETEANEFAAELLMPENLFRSLCPQTEPTVSGIEVLTEAFKTTLTAALVRFVDLGARVSALVVSRDGRVRWFRAGKDFRFRIRSPGRAVDPRSCAGSFFQKRAGAGEPDVVSASAWLEDSRVESSWTLRELLLPLPRYATTLSLLWVPPGSAMDAFDEDE